jgi:hypothetical protein
VLQARIDRGATAADLIDELTTAMLECRAAGKERDDDLLADGLDMLTGWVGRGRRLSFPRDVRER